LQEGAHDLLLPTVDRRRSDILEGEPEECASRREISDDGSQLFREDVGEVLGVPRILQRDFQRKLRAKKWSRKDDANFLASSQELVNRLTVGSENPMAEPFFTANAIIARYHLNSPMRSGPH